MSYLKKFRSKFDPILLSYFEKKIEKLNNIHFEGKKIGEVIRDFTIQGGKKFRPALFFAAYTSYNNRNTESILNLSIFLELLHSFALIHDDIIDHSPLRRGYPTLQVQFDTEIAILLGDMAMILTDEIFMQHIFTSSFSRNVKKQSIDCFNTLKQEVLIGEYLDYIKDKDVQTIMLLKTARYSFVRPIELGLILAGADRTVIDKWKHIAVKTGLLFQRKDDYIGTFGSEEEIGKSVTSDIEEGKNTFITQMFLIQAAFQEKERFTAFFGKGNVKSQDFQWYLSLLIKKGIQQKAQEVIKKDAVSIKKLLEPIDSSLPLFVLLDEIIDTLAFFSS